MVTRLSFTELGNGIALLGQHSLAAAACARHAQVLQHQHVAACLAPSVSTSEGLAFGTVQREPACCQTSSCRRCEGFYFLHAGRPAGRGCDHHRLRDDVRGAHRGARPRGRRVRRALALGGAPLRARRGAPAAAQQAPSCARRRRWAAVSAGFRYRFRVSGACSRAAGAWSSAPPALSHAAGADCPAATVEGGRQSRPRL